MLPCVCFLSPFFSCVSTHLEPSRVFVSGETHIMLLISFAFPFRRRSIRRQAWRISWASWLVGGFDRPTMDQTHYFFRQPPTSSWPACCRASTFHCQALTRPAPSHTLSSAYRTTLRFWPLTRIHPLSKDWSRAWTTRSPSLTRRRRATRCGYCKCPSRWARCWRRSCSSTRPWAACCRRWGVWGKSGDGF